MQTLKEKIEESKTLFEKLKQDFPQITNVWFEFRDIPVAEIQEKEQEINDTSDVVLEGGKDVLRLLVSNGTNPTIFAYSLPVKKISAKYLVEETTEKELV